MRFLVDEDVPEKLLRFLASSAHDAVRVKPQTSDINNMRRAKSEGRMLITLDKDCANIAMGSAESFDVLHFRIHPPYADSLIDAFKNMTASLPPSEIKGLLSVTLQGHIRYK
ncbi:MAG: DUF5615 family PIN-like protein [Candidatus Omnitrophica bacterium]|nr:DUF5615 family PIN-like protein [Candidatus Omnitrophota bacterium]